MEKEMNDLYKEIAETINQMIPEDWEKFYFYAQISETGGRTYFFYNTTDQLNRFNYSAEIPFNFKIDRDNFNKNKRYLFELAGKIRDVFNKNDQELWYSFTMSLERSGKLNVHFDYTDWFKTDYGFTDQLVIWKYKYLGIKSDNERHHKIIDKYLSEFPDNPI